MTRLMRTTVALLTVLLLVLVTMEFARGQDRVPPATRPEASGRPPGLDQQLLQGLELKPSDQVEPPSPPTVDGPATREGSDERAQGAPATGSDVGPQNPLADIEQRMRRVEQRLRRKELASETQQTQREIVARLDELIATLSESLQPQPSQSAREPGQDDSQATEAGPAPARSATGQADNETVTEDAQAAVILQRTSDQVWGHLPERLREQMQNAQGIEFLPQYRQLIEDYFRRLAGEREARR